jgi:adenylosuccinate synthase
MKVDVLLGLQWGDEGKGKVVDVLTPRYDIITRFQGGPNAGHTLEFNNIKHILHNIPSGIFREETLNLITNGVVLDPMVFKREIDALEAMGMDLTKNLWISRKAHLILPTHQASWMQPRKQPRENPRSDRPSRESAPPTWTRPEGTASVWETWTWTSWGNTRH